MSTSRVESIIAQAARSWPRQPAIIDAYGVLDYQSLAEQVGDVSVRLRRQGIGPGMGVGIMARNGRGFVIGAFGALSAGATIMPISHQMTVAEVQALLTEAPVHAVLDDGSGARLLGPADAQMPLTDRLALSCRLTALERRRPFVDMVPDAAFVRFTSGTTGAAKGVVLTHQAMMERTAAANRGLCLGADDCVVWVLQMAFHFVVSVVLYLRYGAAIAVAGDNLAETVLDVANQHGATLLYASPVHYQTLANGSHTTRFDTLRRAISTSTALAGPVAVRFFERYGLPVAQAYGIIEVGLPLINLRRAADVPQAVGHPLPDYEVAILDDRGALLECGQIGELGIRGPGMFAAYMSPARRRDEVLSRGWFLTGDLARQDADGLVTVVGRHKAMINVAGNKVFPEEVECVLDSHPRVRRSRVLGRPHPRMGEVLHAQVELRAPGTTFDPEELIAYCRARLSAYRVPHSIEIVDQIATTSSEKIRRV